ncbi:IclR family pca regulon transcriptional regulator [Nocardioides salarius]|uniref:IclR family pca regulon transcriptional regulator n=1 Tax=Nocardioides salarius TaxID=374513 RepID=A0ABS2M9J6_9ACTN|nr:IclR family transcriptional regulator C-terminal domain-containing protein [Nocardioides salarius]MBM7507827.1 IclR family pca regulon transcriptional regulator [Nocardioides salarius]
MSDPSTTAPVEPIQALVRGLAVIRAFDVDHPAMTLSDVARRSGTSRATARRILHTLVGVGYVDSDGRSFRLRPQVLELGWAYLASLRLPELVQPHLESLSSLVGESCSVAVLDGTDVVYVARVATRRIMTVGIHVGTRFPAHVTAMGRAILASSDPAEQERVLAGADLSARTSRTLTDPARIRSALAAVAEQGYALNDQELETGLRSLAVAIRGRDGRPVAAVNVSTHASRGPVEDTVEDLLPPLRATRDAIEADLAMTSA